MYNTQTDISLIVSIDKNIEEMREQQNNTQKTAAQNKTQKQQGERCNYSMCKVLCKVVKNQTKQKLV